MCNKENLQTTRFIFSLTLQKKIQEQPLVFALGQSKQQQQKNCFFKKRQFQKAPTHVNANDTLTAIAEWHDTSVNANESNLLSLILISVLPIVLLLISLMIMYCHYIFDIFGTSLLGHDLGYHCGPIQSFFSFFFFDETNTIILLIITLPTRIKRLRKTTSHMLHLC